jgi:phage tail-like protein
MAVVDHNSNPYGAWPLAKFYFQVTIDEVDTSIGFQAVEGLESEISTMEYRAGNYALWAKTKRPGMMTYSNVTLKKGMFKADANLHDWWKSLETDHMHSARRTVVIELLNEENAVCIRWELQNCFVVKFTPTGLDAEADSEVAIEEMEIAYEKLNITMS